MLNRAFEPNQTFRPTAADPLRLTTSRGLLYRRAVGGSSVHFAANYWRFRPIDFKERSVLGPISGTGFADWPITYEELEPYYTKVDWEIGVSGAPGPFDPPRSRPYPMPPLPNKSSGVLLERGARSLGLHAQVDRRPGLFTFDLATGAGPVVLQCVLGVEVAGRDGYMQRLTDQDFVAVDGAGRGGRHYGRSAEVEHQAGLQASAVVVLAN
ncbi:MAG: hypothetical protein LAO22_06030 [Acidobacteriia bacterium]|nr:hypothetical protein [Terriglobia bacterium]